MSHTDKHLTEKIHNLGRGQLAFWTLLSTHGVYVFVFFFLGVWAASNWSPATFGRMSLSIGLSLAITFVLRYTIRRPRPDFFSTNYIPALQKYSFPSAHASSVFNLATTTSLLYLASGETALTLSVTFVLFALAVLISTSRIMVGVHYFSDVVIGAILGVLVALGLLFV